MKVHGYLCDCGCGQSGQSKATEMVPEGWVHVFPGGLHFASWACLARYAATREPHPVRVQT